MKRALVTGITGQDGSYLAEFLLQKGYEVTGMVRRSSTDNLGRIRHMLGQITLRPGDLLDQSSLISIASEVQPSEVYNLASQSFVPASWEQPIATTQFTGLGVARLFEAIRQPCPHARFYQAGSSEMFRKAAGVPQNERTPPLPAQPVRGGQDLWALGNRKTMWLMLQQKTLDDYVIATGEIHSIRELVELAFGAAGLDWQQYVVVNPKLRRPAEVELLQGDATKARTRLGWKPKVSPTIPVNFILRAEPLWRSVLPSGEPTTSSVE